MSERGGDARGVGDFMAAERARILAAATPERREQMRAAEGSARVIRAWSAVVAGTREAAHVSGVRYLPESNKLLVYADSEAMACELTMAREILRARMERAGASIDGFVIKVSRAEYQSPAQRAAAAAAGSAQDGRRAAPAGCSPRAPRPAPRAHPLTPEQESALDESVSPIADERLARALKNAMKASFEHEVTGLPHNASQTASGGFVGVFRR